MSAFSAQADTTYNWTISSANENGSGDHYAWSRGVGRLRGHQHYPFNERGEHHRAQSRLGNADDILQPTSSLKVDTGGISFQTSAVWYHLYEDGSNIVILPKGFDNFDVVTFTATPASPEPGSTALQDPASPVAALAARRRFPKRTNAPFPECPTFIPEKTVTETVVAQVWFQPGRRTSVRYARFLNRTFAFQVA